jgi:hypothetical protein
MTSKVSRRAAAVAWALAIGLAQAAPAYAQATTTRIVEVTPWETLLDPADPFFRCLPGPILLRGQGYLKVAGMPSKARASHGRAA